MDAQVLGLRGEQAHVTGFVAVTGADCKRALVRTGAASEQQ